MKDINRYVTRKHAVDWKDIGIELDLKLSALNIIESNHPLKCEACFQAMIDKWIESTSENVTWRALEIALTNVNRQKLDLDPVDDVYGRETALFVCTRAYCQFVLVGSKFAGPAFCATLVFDKN